MERMKAYLHECPLNFSVSTGSLRKPPSTNSINLIHEDDARFVFARVPEHLTHHARRLADVLVDDRTGHDLEEVGVERGCDCTREQGLARSRRTVEEHALWRLDTHSEEELGVQ